jgi:hypothetical protein
MIELISGFIGVIIGGVVTYYVSIKVLRERLEHEQVYAFISKNFLPLLGAVRVLLFNMKMWMDVEMKKVRNEPLDKLSEDEAFMAFKNGVCTFETALDNFIKSGTILLVREINENLFNYILGFYHHVQRGTLRKLGRTSSEEKFLIPDENFVKFLIEFDQKLSRIPIPDLLKKYKGAMKRGFILKEER